MSLPHAMLPIVYINLDSDSERRQRMQAEFERAGLAAERFAATRWTELSAEQQTRYYSDALNARQFHKPLVNGEKGCYASHLRAWQWLLDSPHAALVVLEDDVRLEPGFAAVIQALGEQTMDWDMVKLISHLNRHEGARKLHRPQDLAPGFQRVRYKRIPSLTAGYVISRAGAAKLLASRLPFGRPIDVDLRYWWENGLDVQGVEPAVIALDDTSQQSSVGAKAPDSLATTWRKFRRKAAYTMLNRWHRA